MSGALPYSDFYYPLNVFAHILTLEEGGIRDLHYGLFEREDEPIAAAQERSTTLLLSTLPPPPARILDAGSGLGATLARLTALGYEAEGMTPDVNQAALVDAPLRVHCCRFEDFAEAHPYDAVVFQESSQYIDSDALFAKAAELTQRVIVLDEFATRSGGSLHQFADFLRAAGAHGFVVERQEDVTAKAAPTIEYFMRRIPQFRARLVADLALTDRQIDELIASGEQYRQSYREGAYVYRLLVFRRTPGA